MGSNKMYFIASLLALASVLLEAKAVYVPGTPGAPWTVEEQMAVKGRLYYHFKRNLAPNIVRLSFHDCLKYTDGTGGCDGCLNFSGVGERFPLNLHTKDLPDQFKTNNNGLDKAVSKLEEIYTTKDRPKGTPKLKQSLQDSGKSRADLWAFAAIAAVEYGMEMNNIACDNVHDARVMNKTCMIEQGQDCKIL